MGTRSSIAVLNPADGTVKAVYCQYDGYLDGVGTSLLLAFNTYEQASKLVKIGDLSSIDYTGRIERGARTNKNAIRGEYPDFETYKKEVSHIGDNGYRYILLHGDWYVWGGYVAGPDGHYGGLRDQNLRKVETVLAEKEENR